MKRATKAICLAISCIILILLASYAYAKPVTQEMAKRIAEAFLQKEQAVPPKSAIEAKKALAVRETVLAITIGNIRRITDEDGKILAYVQELKPQGFIITSADDSIRPVIGFSLSGKFSFDIRRGNPLLDLLKADIQARQKAVLTRVENLKALTRSNNEKWASVMKEPGKVTLSIRETSSTQWGPYIQTTWSQAGIYRSKCPYKDPGNPGSRRPTGCTAISMAQIMYMHKYPKNISFSENDHYISRAAIKNAQNEIIGYDVIDLDGDSSPYRFPTFEQLNNSLNQIAYSGSEEEIANLCFATGIKLHMTYGRSGSGAWRPQAYVNDFNYGSAIQSRNWNSVNDDVVQNMKDGLPVQIAIYNSDPSITGGHSIIIDGYRDDGFFHLNYGWGGSSPNSITETWYNIPDMPRYDVVSMVIYDISVYQGWNQIGADQRNSYRAIYPSPVKQPERKWLVNIPTSLPIPYSYSHLVIGTGGRIYTSLGPSIMGDIYHPYIAIYNKFGTREDLIEVTHSNADIPYLCQNQKGEIFFSSGTDGPTATTSKIYRLNPKTDDITPIFTHSSPDSGNAGRPIKVDRDNYLYFVIGPRYTVNYAKFYSISRTGTNKWTPHSFPSSAEFHTTIPAIDEERDRVYLNYFEKTEEYKGRSHLIAFKRSDGTVVFDEILPNIPIHYASAMAGAPSIDEDGTVYIGAFTSLYAYSANGSKLWEKSFYPAYTNKTTAIGNDGTLYINYGKMVDGNWRPGYIRALNPATGNTKWEVSLGLSESDHMGEIYATSNGMVIYSYDRDGQHRLGGIKDDGPSGEKMWDIKGGGTLAFGPGQTIFSIPPGHNQAIYALTDRGDYGDPEGKGMNYADNVPPFSPSTPTPSDGSVNQSAGSVQLSWACSDPNENALKYDIYACALVEGEEMAFVPVATQIEAKSFTLSDLREGTQYLWLVVATDGQAISQGPVWTFSTIGGEPPLLGDINGDKVVDLADVLCGLKVLSGLQCTAADSGADVNGDGKIGVYEVLYVMQVVSGLR